MRKHLFGRIDVRAWGAVRDASFEERAGIGRSIRPWPHHRAARTVLVVLTPRSRLALVCAVGAERLYELHISARNRARSGPAAQASPRTYPLMVAAHAALFTVSAWPRRRRMPAAIELLALAGLATSTVLRLWVIRTLGESWNVTAHVAPRT